MHSLVTSHSSSILQKSEDILNQQTEQKDGGSEENTVDIIQNIRINKKCYSIFYNTSCSNIVATYHAIKDFGNKSSRKTRAIFNRCVGDSHVKSDHSIYQVKFLLHNGKDTTFSGICLDEITLPYMSCKDV